MPGQQRRQEFHVVKAGQRVRREEHGFRLPDRLPHQGGVEREAVHLLGGGHGKVAGAGPVGTVVFRCVVRAHWSPSSSLSSWVRPFNGPAGQAMGRTLTAVRELTFVQAGARRPPGGACPASTCGDG
ncbi:hypothetical protein GCM10018773_64180 [Streptomyces candidus]|nr:hypothetical protein GCM10018773_64180 [Streptomyces candidus]